MSSVEISKVKRAENNIICLASKQCVCVCVCDRERVRLTGDMCLIRFVSANNAQIHTHKGEQIG